MRIVRELNKKIKLLIVFLLVISISMANVTQFVLAIDSDKTVDIEVSVDDNSVKVGETFTYTIQYAYSSNSINFDSTEKIIVELADGMSFVEAELSADVESVSESNGTVTFDMVDEINSGTTGYVTLSAKYLGGSLEEELEDQVIDVSLDTDAANVTITNTVKIDVSIDSNFSWSIGKSVTDPSYGSDIDPMVGSQITYKITLNGNDSVGGFNIDDITVTDTLPDGAEYVSSSPEASVDGQVLTWQYDELKAGSSETIEVIVDYPESEYIYEDVSVTNEVEAIGYDDDDNSDTITASVSHSFGEASPKLSGVTKKSRAYDANDEDSADEYSKNQTIEYSISGIGNAGNVLLDTITVYDTIPNGIIIEEASIPSRTTSSSLAYVTSELTTSGAIKASDLDWIEWNGSDDLGSTIITGLKWIFTDVVVGESISTIDIEASFDSDLSVDKDVSYENRVMVDAYAEDYNDAGDDYDTHTDGTTLDDVANVKLVDELPWLSIDKSVTTSSVYEGDTVEYSITFTNNTYATGDFETNDKIVIYDDFPEYDSDNNGTSDTDVFENIVVTDKTGLSYSVNADNGTFTIEGIALEPGNSYTVNYEADIVDGVIVGSYENTATATLTDDDESGKVGNRSHDLDDSASVYVKFQGSLKSIKGIGYNIYNINSVHSVENLLLTDEFGEVLVEDADGNILIEDTDTTDDDEKDFYRVTSSTGQFAMPQGIAIVNATLEGGNIRYRLEVSNDDSNGPITDIVIIDRLPAIDDTGTMLSTERGSDWSPYLISEVTDDDDDVTVYYTTEDLSYSYNKTLLKATEDICVGTEVSVDTDIWKSDFSEINITEVTHIMFVFSDDVELYPGDDSISVEWDMRVPLGTPTKNSDGDNAIAWNSFAYGATYKVIDDDSEEWEAFLPAEPIMVGIRVEDDSTIDSVAYIGKIGDYIWEDIDKDGLQDSDETGVNNIKVNLYYDEEDDGVVDIDRDNPYDTTYTSDTYSGDAGYYLFPNLKYGDYIVEFEMPDNYYITDEDVNSNGTDESDSDFTAVDDGGVTYYQSSTITLGVDEENLTIDAGIYQKALVGDLVWIDSDADGIQDSGESGLDESVTVTLYQYSASLGTWQDKGSTTTDSSGNYEFTGLDPGTYYLKFSDIPTEYKVSDKDAGSDNSVDSDVDTDTYETNSFSLTSGEEDMTWDMGVHKAILGDYVWHDIDRDGVQDSSEAGIEDVEVYLYETSDVTTTIKTDTTDSSGEYLFTDLDSGDYTVKFEIPSGYSPTNNDQQLDDAIDSDGVLDTSQMVTGSYNLEVGEIDLTVDMGYYLPGEIGNFVFHDKNYNGIQDSGEEGIEDVTLYLIDDNGDNIDVTTLDIETDNPTTTDTNGKYYFEDLYLLTAQAVKAQLPTGYDGFTLTNQGSDDAIDSDGVYTDFTDATATSHYVTLTEASNTDYTLDFGVFKYATLGNRVWIDENGNGIQDGTETTGVDDVTVILYQDDVEVDRTVTAGNGYYEFTELTPGDYSVEFTLPDDYSITLLNSGSDDGTDSDASSENDVAVDSIGVIDDITLESGEVNYTYDVGIHKSFSLGDYVWIDSNGDGIQDSDEEGINDVSLALYKLNDDTEDYEEISTTSTINNTTTGKDGYYIFDDLPLGEYYVVATLPDGYYLSDSNSGSDDSADSDLYSSGSIYRTGTYTFTDPKTVVDDVITEPTVDIGLFEKTAQFGDYVWIDANYNGTQDSDESPVSGIKVELFRNDGTTAIDTTYTDDYGFYQFTNLAPGSYDLTFKLPDDYYVTRIVSGDDETNSDATLSSDEAYGEINDYVLYIDDDITSLDVGIFKYATLGDYYWYDDNADGIQDSQELTVDGKTVTLSYYDDVTDTTYDTYKTDTTVNGEYLFENLYPGTYTVSFENVLNYNFTSKNSKEDDAVDSDVDDLGQTENIVLESGDDDRTNDSGIFKYVKLGDLVWLDVNRDGIQDTDEVGLAGVEVILYQDGVEVESTTTDDNGNYEFDELNPGEYELEFTVPDDYSITELDGTVDDSDSDGVSENDEILDTIAIIEEIVLTSGEEDMTYDLGLYESFSLGDYVWLDEDGDGIQDSDEVGVNEIEIKLYMYDEETDAYTVIDSTETAENLATGTDGYYDFIDLPMGEYYIEVIKPEAYEFTEYSRGNDTTIDSNIDLESYPGESRTPSITFDENTVAAEDGELTDPSIDIGLDKIAGLGNKVWIDTNYNGIQDADEGGLEGVEVRLYKAGVLVEETDLENPTYTDEDGYYWFLDIDPDVYSLEFVLPDGYNLTHKNIGDDDELDSDGSISSTGSEIVEIVDYQLYIDEFITSLDIGVYQYASLGDYYWYDDNMDGLQDDDEAGVEDQMITLTYDEVTIDDDTNTLIYTETTKTAMTDSNGYYLFDNLNPGTYEVDFDLVDSYIFTYADEENDDTVDSDVDENGYVGDIELISGEHIPTIDAGIYEYASLGDVVWNDKDRDGNQDGDEEGFEGVEVVLYQGGEVIESTTTDENGNYEFDDLLPGDYTLEFTIPDDYSITVSDNTSDDSDSDGTSDNDLVQDETAIIEGISLDNGENDMTLDLGLYSSFSLGDYVWLDTNGDGLQDSDEEGVNAVEVNLYMLDETAEVYEEIDTVLTVSNDGQDGYYEFTDLPMGEYYIEVIEPGNHYFTIPNAGDDESIDSNIDQETYPDESRTDSVIFDEDTVDADSDALTDPSLDIGLIMTAGLGDRVWVDANYNGVQDADEEGLEGVEVRLYQDGELVAIDGLDNATYTDENGYYEFSDIDPGIYSLEFDLPDDYYLTHNNIGSDDELDSDGSISSTDDDVVVIDDYQLYVDEAITSLDIGVYQYASLGDYYWYDTIEDGIQGDSEKGVDSQTVTLSYDTVTVDDDTNTLIYTEATSTTTTDSEGYYLFADLYPGTYEVAFEIKSGYEFTDIDEGDDESIDSDVSEDGYVVNIVLTSGENDLTIDAGIHEEEEDDDDSSSSSSSGSSSGSTDEETTVEETTETKEIVEEETEEVEEVVVEETVTEEETEIVEENKPEEESKEFIPKIIEVVESEEPNDVEIDEVETEEASNEEDDEEDDSTKDRVFTTEEDVDSIEIARQPEHGTVEIDEDNNIVYTPDETFEGEDTVIVVIEKDGEEFIMEIDIFDEEIAQGILSEIPELPQTGGIPLGIFFGIGMIFILLGLGIKKFIWQ